MSGETAYYHDNKAIVSSRLQCAEFRGAQTRLWLLFSIRSNCNKSPCFSTSHYSPLKLNLLVPWNCATKKSMWHHHHHHPPPSLQSRVLPNTVREFILFMRSRFTEGQQLGPDSLMAEPPFITAEPTLWSRLGSHLAQRIETPLKYSIMH